jgi:hypothetical protein
MIRAYTARLRLEAGRLEALGWTDRRESPSKEKNEKNE